MPDQTAICNLALARIGQPRIMSMDDASQPARYCKDFYDPTVEEVLRDHDWNFARKRATLAQLADAPAFEWLYAYQLPNDCITVRQINGWETTEPRPSWEIEGRTLVTDEAVVQIVYTSRATAALFDGLFVEALVLKLASKLSRPLSGSNNMGSDFLKEYEAIVSRKARRSDAAESRVRRKLPWAESDLVASRGAFGWTDPYTGYTGGNMADEGLWVDSEAWP